MLLAQWLHVTLIDERLVILLVLAGKGFHGMQHASCTEERHERKSGSLSKQHEQRTTELGSKLAAVGSHEVAAAWTVNEDAQQEARDITDSTEKEGNEERCIHDDCYAERLCCLQVGTAMP